MLLAILRLIFPYAGWYIYHVWHMDGAIRVYGPCGSRLEAKKEITPGDYPYMFTKFELW